MVLILGGGLAGMSTAYHLGDVPHLVLEGDSTPGGLCRSRNINGFVFDYTGHLLHLRDPRIVEWINELLPDAFDVIERKAHVHTHGVDLPFPFQANLHGLPAELVAQCLADFVRSMPLPLPEDPATSFETWSLSVFGRGISDLFMLPYNAKLFQRAPREMTADWVAWAVPKPSLDELVRGALGIENRGMGYNPSFRYPKQGGIDVLPRTVAGLVKHMRTDAWVREVDLDRRRVTLADGETLDYDRLVVTNPLPAFLRMARGGPGDLDDLAGRLDWSVVGCVNIGVARPAIAGGAHWIYYPDDDPPFYRAGFPSNFAGGVGPTGTSSIYVEFGLARNAPYDPEALTAAALSGLRRVGILEAQDEVLATDCIRIDPGYVIFDRERQAVMSRIAPELADLGVDLIGRYGAWTYSYMERALLDGLELAHEIRAAEGLPVS